MGPFFGICLTKFLVLFNSIDFFSFFYIFFNIVLERVTELLKGHFFKDFFTLFIFSISTFPSILLLERAEELLPRAFQPIPSSLSSDCPI